MKLQRFVQAPLVAMVLTLVLPCVVEGQGRRGNEEGRLLRDAAALESRGDYERAEMVLRRLLDIDPTSTGGLFALDRVFRAQGEPEKILPVVDVFIDTNSSSSGVRYLKLRGPEPSWQDDGWRDRVMVRRRGQLGTGDRMDAC